jgi:metallo-beta-lactamase class B
MIRVMAMLVLLVQIASAQSGVRPAGVSASEAQAVAPIRIFDNFYYVGNTYVSAYVLRTSAGLIMIDALHDQWTNISLQAMSMIGLNPKDIKYVIVTHGHNDHFGGAQAVKNLSGARIALTDADWKLIEGGRGNGPSRDMVIREGETLTLGDTTVKFYVTPGHTPGVASMEFPVFDSGRQYKAFLFGGHNVTNNQAQAFEQMIATVKRLSATLQGVDAYFTSHPWAASVVERGEKIRARKAGDPNPYIAPADFQAFLKERLSDHEMRLSQMRSQGQR